MIVHITRFTEFQTNSFEKSVSRGSGVNKTTNILVWDMLLWVFFFLLNKVCGTCDFFPLKAYSPSLLSLVNEVLK